MGAPPSLTVNGSVVPLWKYDQLDSLNRANLKTRCIELSEACNAIDPSLTSGLMLEPRSMWIIDVQCRLAHAVLGMELSHADFGVPPVGGGRVVTFPAEMRKKPFVPWTTGSPCLGGSTQDHEFHFDASYSRASATATAENHANRQMHRGTVGHFIFGASEAPHEAPAPWYPGARPDTSTGKATTNESFAPPPQHAYAYQSKA